MNKKRKRIWIIAISSIGGVLLIVSFYFWLWSTPYSFLNGARPVAYRVFSFHAATSTENHVRVYEINDRASDVLIEARKELTTVSGWTEDYYEDSSDVEFLFTRGDEQILIISHPANKSKTAVFYNRNPTKVDWIVGSIFNIVPERYSKWLGRL